MITNMDGSDKRMTVHFDGKPIYDIVFRNDFSDLIAACSALEIKDKNICIVSDTNVSKYYLEEVTQLFKTNCKSVTSFVFHAGEKQKNLNVVRDLYEHLILHHFERRDFLVALGGGVVGDLTGYTAATYLRGISFIQIPTSLLAQVDSSIGGKTGVDFDSYKNMVGAFHQPKLVYINTATLLSLPNREYYSGLGEVIKYGIITDATFYDWLIEHKEGIRCRDMNMMQQMIMHSCDNKRLVVEEDPTEKGCRALLNFGHTLGHAIEKLTNFQYLHGECVAVGSILSTIISVQKNLISADWIKKLADAFAYYDLPKITEYDIRQVVDTVKSDKKMSAGRIRFILFDQIGHAFISDEVTDDDMKLALEAYCNGTYKKIK